MKVSQLKAALARCIRAKRPAMIWSKPGVGKSSVVAQVSEAMGYALLDFRLVQMDSVDLRGIPQVRDGRTHWAPPAELPTKASGKTVIFFDEFVQASTSVQNAASQLLLDRRLGGYVLPEETVMIAAGNRDEDRAATTRMPTHLANRFCHYLLDVDAVEWLAWAQQDGSKVDPRIFAFVKYRPALLHTFNPTASKEKAFASPRSWVFASDLLREMDADKFAFSHEERVEEFAGVIGMQAAVEFAGFLSIADKLTDLDAILLDPSRAAVPSDSAVCYAVCYALLDRATRKTLPAITTYLARFAGEWQVLFFSEVKARKEDLCKTKEFIGWVAKNPNML